MRRKGVIEKPRIKDIIDKEQQLCHDWSGSVVVSLSGGLGSAVALLRCVDIYGPSRVYAVFADTLSEDADLYRFLDDVEQAADVPVYRLSDGRDIWDVFDQHGIMRIRGACKASIELKAKPIDKFLRDNFSPETTAVVFGMNWTEPERVRRLREKKLKDGFKALFPLFMRPCLSECGMREYIEARGIRIPRLYALGYPHNNCGGCCVLAGQKQWAGTLKDFPDRFEYAEERERAFNKNHNFTVLYKEESKDGIRVKHSYSLETLRNDIEAGKAYPETWRSSCSCFTDASDADESDTEACDV